MKPSEYFKVIQKRKRKTPAKVPSKKPTKSLPKKRPKRRKGEGNRRESIAMELAQERGYEILQYGWPDLLLYRESDNKAVFVEVKAKPINGKQIAGATNLNHRQGRMHEVLKKLGLDVQIIYIE